MGKQYNKVLKRRRKQLRKKKVNPFSYQIYEASFNALAGGWLF